MLVLPTCSALVVALLVSAKPAQASGNKFANTDIGANASKAERYCVRHGGEVDVRAPYFNTNDDPSNWLRLSGSRQFCKFTAKDGSRIHVELSTLYSQLPTLAALAYYAKVPYNGSCNGNPASCYCSQLGGTDLFGGINLNGGGWVQKSDHRYRARSLHLPGYVHHRFLGTHLSFLRNHPWQESGESAEVPQPLHEVTVGRVKTGLPARLGALNDLVLQRFLKGRGSNRAAVS
jgi:putative hemolysin